jgi:hypothetical protein
MINRNPVLLAGAVRTIILCAVSFGLQWTPEQIASTMLAVEAVLGLFVKSNTVSRNNVDVMVEKRVAERDVTINSMVQP